MADNFKSNNSTIEKIKELFEFVEQKDSAKVNELLGNNEISPKSLNIALVKAFSGYKVCESTREIVSTLLRYKADPDGIMGKSTGTSLLQAAAQENDVKMGKILLASGAKVNHRDMTGKTALFYILLSGKQDIDEFVALLLDYNLDANLCDAEGNSPLGVAIQRGYINTVRMLLETHLDIDYPHPISGNTALHYAVIHNRFEIVKLLVSKKSKITILNKQNQTAIDLSMQLNRTDMYTYLAEEYNKIEETQNNQSNNFINI
jgi:ankyrin repeat protein